MSDPDLPPIQQSFCAGTKIATPKGQTAVESLKIGDLVETLHGGIRPVKWIGRRAYRGKRATQHPHILPIRIAAGALEDGIPARDLLVAPGHGICIDGGLVPASRLLNAVTITQEKPAKTLEYIHLELDEHEVLIADGCPAESFFEERLRGQFDNAAEFATRYPQPRPFPAVECLPRLEDGFVLQAIQLRLAERAGMAPTEILNGKLRGFVDVAGPTIVAGWAQCETQPEEPVCLDILVDGKRVIRALANRYRADLQSAGLGSGNHSFQAELPEPATGTVEVRRTLDQAPLPLTDAALGRAA